MGGAHVQMPDDREVDLTGADVTPAEIESALARIPSVTAARVVAEPGGRITEVHVLARRDRAPKQVVRDVQSVAMAAFGIDVDYRTVSVVQLDEPPTEEEQVAAPRVALMRLSAEIAGPATEIRVSVRAGGEEHVGSARGPASSGLRLVARAVSDAVTPLIPDAAVDVDFADVVPAGASAVAIAVLRQATTRGDQVVSGSAVVRKDANDAMARATLAALNRLVASR